MAVGRKPPIIQPRNMLAEGRIAGRRPPLPFRLAVQRQYEHQRLERGLRPIAAIGGAPPPPRSVDLLAARNGINPAHERAIDRAGAIIRKVQDRIVREECRPQDGGIGNDPSGAAKTNVGSRDPRSARPPKPGPGRYGGLKDGPVG